jgi:RTX calcium-binding nonapeptide repeat (4 copies)
VESSSEPVSGSGSAGGCPDATSFVPRLVNLSISRSRNPIDLRVYSRFDTFYGATPLFGGTQGVTIDVRAGNDRVFGSAGNDTLTGGTGDDTVSGGRGDDSLDGGAGSDRVEGGAGDDTCLNGETLTSCEH